MGNLWIHAGLQSLAKEFRYITILKIIPLFSGNYKKTENFSFYFTNMEHQSNHMFILKFTQLYVVDRQFPILCF